MKQKGGPPQWMRFSWMVVGIPKAPALTSGRDCQKHSHSSVCSSSRSALVRVSDLTNLQRHVDMSAITPVNSENRCITDLVGNHNNALDNVEGNDGPHALTRAETSSWHQRRESEQLVRERVGNSPELTAHRSCCRSAVHTVLGFGTK